MPPCVTALELLDGWGCEDLPTIDGGVVTRLGLACSLLTFRRTCSDCQPPVIFTDRRCYDTHHHLRMTRCAYCGRWLYPASIYAHEHRHRFKEHAA